MQKLWYGGNFKVGVLGGGQLGRMLIQEAVNYNVQIHCLDPDAKAPCSEIAHSFKVGALTDFETVYQFGQDKDVITVEIENVNVDALEKLEIEGKKVFPQPSVLRIVQDKGLQKQFYLENEIPTADFRLIDSIHEMERNSDFFPFFQKLRKGGYDGKGVAAIKSEKDIKNAFHEPSVLEKLVDFQKEISVIISRNEAGEVSIFPVVECVFSEELNLVELLFSPANISLEIEKNAKEIATKIIQKLNMVGLLAIELFLTKSGDLLVNEIAPRPHNSGHHTIECNHTSQYEQHLRSILNLPLGSTKAIQKGVMINLLGEPNYIGEARYEGIEEIMKFPGVKVHLYGKSITKPHRKMGHITVVSEDLQVALTLAEQVKQMIQVKA
jgi:5-(carboxyamino)imidazole ribonucleotide synthase